MRYIETTTLKSLTTLPVFLSLWLSLIFVLSLFNTTAEIYGTDSSLTENETSTPVGPQFSLNILSGASVQGNPAFDPSTLTVVPGSMIEVANLDTVPHTVTSGKGPSDKESGKAFDTGIIDAGDISYINTSDSNVGVGNYPFYCSIHPYLKGRLVVENEIAAMASSTPSPAQGTTLKEQEEPLSAEPPISTQMAPQQTPKLAPPQNSYPSPTGQLPATSTNPVILLDQNSYVDSTGTLHIVGEVQNISYETVDFVEIIATLYDAYNQVVGTSFAYTQPSDLAPGQRAPFDILVLGGNPPARNTAYYTLYIDTS